MGMTRLVDCPHGVPDWPRVAAWLAQHGAVAQPRMIDGQLAFPDEAPPDNWREIRVALAGGMVTIRRLESAVEVVTWGNADEAMKQAWETVARAFAEAGVG
jgi:hypothetical protein